MHEIQDSRELATLRAAGTGFIVNARNDGIKVHRTACDAIGLTISLAYPKRFFETYEEAVQWVTDEYDTRWSICDKCAPGISPTLEIGMKHG